MISYSSNITALDRSLCSCTKLYDSVMSSLIKAPMSFFDSVPIGRLISRCSTDQQVVDFLFHGNAASVHSLAYWFFVILGTICLIASLNPLFALCLPFVGYMYYTTQLKYRSCSWELQRFDSLTRAKLLALFNESISGITVIKAFEQSHSFIKEIQKLIDNNSKHVFMMRNCTRWLGQYVELIGAITVLVTTIVVVLSSRLTNLSTGIAGLSISYSLLISSVLNIFLQRFIFVENSMDSVVKLLEYCQNIPSELAFDLATDCNTVEWPSKGNIDIQNLTIRYDPTSNDIIKQVSMNIRGGEKVGVVGRTGAGKSTLMLAIFRIVEPFDGNIVIDNINIQDLGLNKLRSNLGIIPQESLLFEGSIRFNLDPLNQFSDDEIWKALENVNMKGSIMKLDGSLNALVTENGANFSLGQKGQLCVAKALLKKPKILIMDEATASMDSETDSLIQNSIMNGFCQSTILTIAHRLNTIIEYDYIAVLSYGKLVEYGSPAVLLSKHNGHFKSMVDETGQDSSKALHAKAVKINK